MTNEKRNWALNRAKTEIRTLSKELRGLKFVLVISLIFNFMLIVKVGL